MKKGSCKKKVLVMFLSLAMVLTSFLGALPVMAETQSYPETVTVYFSLSNDGEYVVGTDGTVLCRVPMTVSYFPLSDYGLGAFDRTDAGGAVIESPTLLHVYIRAIEQYCLGGESLIPGVSEVEDSDYKALNITGSSGSMYMQQLWGHDENLMYFVNHSYPEISPGWGATADWVLMNNEDEIDVAMFSDWSFWISGGFANFTDTDIVADASGNISTTLQAKSTGMGDPSTVGTQDGTKVYLVSEDTLRNANAGTGNPDVTFTPSEAQSVGTAGTNGVVEIIIPSTAPAGTYYLIAGPDFSGYIPSTEDSRRVAPAVAKVTVPSSFVAVTGITVAPTTLSMTQGDTASLTATIAPADASNKNVTWKSSNTSVATVNANGVVTAAAPGNATITATTADGGFEDDCAVTVSSVVPVTDIALNQTAKAMNPGGTGKLTAKVLPLNASNQGVTWSTSDATVVSVTPSAADPKVAVLTAGTVGTATVTATTVDGNKAASCSVIVNTSTPAIINDYYQIGESDDIFWFADRVNSGDTGINGILTDDFALAGYWIPIGNASNVYTGHFYGDGYTLDKLAIRGNADDDTTYYRGLFGYAENATIENVNLTEATITNAGDVSGEFNIGGILGYAGGGVTIDNCEVDLLVGSHLLAHVGGIVGKVSASSSNPTVINECTVIGGYLGGDMDSDFVQEERYFGGIVGVGYHVQIADCENAADIVMGGDPTYASLNNAGGIAGHLSSDVPGGTSLTDCQNSGDIAATGIAGGIFAKKDSNVTVTNCTNSGQVN